MELEDDVVVVILTGQERGHPGLLHVLFQGIVLRLQLLQDVGVVLLLAHFAKGHQILPGGEELFVPGDLVLQLLEAHLHLLGAGKVVPKAVHGGLSLQAGGLLLGGVNIQRGGELRKLGLHVTQLLLVNVVFDQSHDGFSNHS